MEDTVRVCVSLRPCHEGQWSLVLQVSYTSGICGQFFSLVPGFWGREERMVQGQG